MKNYLITEKLLTYSLPPIAILSITLPLLFGQSNLSLLGSYLAVPMIFAPLIYLKYVDKKIDDFYLLGNSFHLFVSAYFVLFAVSLLTIKMFDTRIIFYYIVVALMATTILLEILLFDLSKNNTTYIIIQIALLTLNIIWGVTLKYFYFIGRTDTIVHAWYVQNLINYGHVSNLFDYYQYFPLWHILCSITYILIDYGGPVYNIMFIISGIIYVFMILITYCISMKIFNNVKFSLATTLFLCLNQDFIFYGMYSIARSVESFFEIILILLILYNKSIIRKTILIAIVSFSAVIYHPSSMPFIIMLFLLIYVITKFYNANEKEEIITLDYIMLIIIMTITYWSFIAKPLFEDIIGNIVNPALPRVLTKSVFTVPQQELFNYLHYSFLLFFMIFGCLWALNNKSFLNSRVKILALLGIFSTVLAFPGPSLLISKFAQNFNLNRFGEYTFIFTSIIAAIGLIFLYKKLRKTYLRIILILIFYIFCFLSVSNDFVASDNPLIKRPFYTFYLNEGEIISFNHISDFTSGFLFSDYITTRYLLNSEHYKKAHLLEVNETNMSFLKSKSNDLIMIRSNELKKRPLKLYTTKSSYFQLDPSWDNMDYYDNNLSLWDGLEDYSKIYESNMITCFI